jgi:RNA polymerase sporulation-specific sigma factor
MTSQYAYKPMAEAELRDLIFRAQHGDFLAKEKLAENNFALVHSIVRRFAELGHDREDLFQVGCIGLLKAIDKFNSEYEVSFSTYAVPLILGEIRRYLRDDRPVGISRGLRERAILIERRRRELRQKLGREPELQLLASDCNLQPEQVLTATEAMRPLISISDLLQGGRNDRERSEDTISVLSVDDSEQMVERLNMAKMLEELPERLAHILRGRYFEEKTQAALAQELHLSQVQISRLEKKALAMIKNKLET